MSGILIYSELESTVLGLLTKGRELAADLDKDLGVVLLGPDGAAGADQYISHGASRVYVADDPQLQVFQAGSYAAALAQVVQSAGAEILLMGATRRGRELAPRLGIPADFFDLSDEEILRLFADKRPDIQDFDAMQADGVLKISLDEPIVSFKEQIADPENHPFPTLSGKIEIDCAHLAEMNNPRVPSVPQCHAWGEVW